MNANEQVNEMAHDDAKRWWWLLSPSIPVMVIGGLACYQLTDLSLFLWVGPILVYVVAPYFDWRKGTVNDNPPKEQWARLENNRFYQYILYCYVPLQYLATLFCVACAINLDVVSFGWVGLCLTAGIVNGIGINTAHELGHKKSTFERFLAKVCLVPVAYGHFFVEHNRGHHVRVATPEDPASARMGESLWEFLPRTFRDSALSAWQSEAKRLKRKGVAVWSLENENLKSWLASFVLFAGLTAMFGWKILLFLILQALFGATLLETVNYIEHYGLKRAMNKHGHYERCKPEHSWNSNHVVTNLLLYNLQRHSDHHANPLKRYQTLCHYDESPQLPSGYASMLLLAYIPSVWFRVMDQLLYEHYKGDIRRANLQPGKEAALLEKWPIATPSREHRQAPKYRECSASTVPLPLQKAG